MYVLIDLAIDAVELAEPHDTKRLHAAVAHGTDRQAVAALLASSRAGHLDEDDDDHLWLRRGWLEERAQGRVGGRWSEDLDHLVSKAQEQGSVDEAGTHVRAHIEWLAAEEELSPD